MTLTVLNRAEKETIREELRKLLILCDSEFVPPLSNRSSTTQKDLSSSNAQSSDSAGIDAYLQGLMEQELLCAIDEGKLAGFVSYRYDYACPEICEDTLPNIYVSTLIVSPDHRRKGLTTRMYSYLFDKFSDRRVFTRTWSENLAHIAILAKFGFVEHFRKKNDRGEGIDTVYYSLR